MDIPRVDLVGDDRELLRQTLKSGMGSAPGLIDSEGWLRHAAATAQHLPDALYSALREFRRDSKDSGAVIVDGFPVDTLCALPTPLAYNSVRHEVTPEVLALIASLSVLGDAVAYEGEKRGALVHDIVPVAGYENTQSNAGSEAFALHIENAFHRYRPDFVLLLCLRQGPDGEARHRLAATRQAVRKLEPEVLRVLFEDRFRTPPPPSFDDGGRPPAHAVLSGALEDPDVRVDLAYTVGLDVEARSALAELGRVLDLNSEVVALSPGQLVVIDNRVTLHGRTPFTPLYDGRDRWLLRAFCKADIRESRLARSHDGRRVGEFA
ncbi:TauD/TfdA family dioxygenase [Streptomyces sp. NPDC015350]|uniref:TauD/TfdA family dioxygenase n=1 Tax=Streptomyces sp. NPDC015350 TaxID=3364955 RepID=UPI003701E060